MHAQELAKLLRDARERTLELVGDLADEQLIGPELTIVNPLLWEIGHVAWFQERWCLREACGHRSSLLEEADALYDSIAVLHDTRWQLHLPTPERVREYMQAVLSRVEAELSESSDPELLELAMLSLFHEDMHGEAFVMTRQTLGYPCLKLPASAEVFEPPGEATGTAERIRGDVAFEGGVFLQGSPDSNGFAFDNERAAHERTVAPFRMSRTCVTQEEFAAFVEDEGYQRRELWSDEGWRWRTKEGAQQPVHWRHTQGGWLRRCFDEWKPLEPRYPVHHVNAHEAEAFCLWAGRRLPSETEWEFAAGRARFPWGDTRPSKELAHLDLQCSGVCDVAAYPLGATPEGLRQMLGNVWEWTSSSFEPYPGFQPGHYREYSEPWFHDHRVVRGGAYPTRARMLHNRLRNFYLAERNDPIVGFRTCAGNVGD